jgi:hypothetical protein
MPIRQDRTLQAVTAELMAAFERTMSADRWKTYMIAGGFKEELAHALYLWNAAIGQSFHYPLQAVEVALRNVIHAALAAEFGGDWWQDARCRAVLHVKRRDDIDKAAHRHVKKYGIPPNTGQIVASVTFGFWASMLHREYNKPIWDARTGDAFPYLGSSDYIGKVSQTATKIQELRNRIFHQEPLIGHNLSEEYAAILRLLGWICPLTRDWVRYHSSVPTVLRQRPR